MSISKIFSVQPNWPEAYIVEIQTEVRPGFSLFSIIGLGDASVQESKRKILSAVRNAGYRQHGGLRKILTLLRPAASKKTGNVHDLSIAYSYLTAAQFLSKPKEKVCCLGELTLDGEVVPCAGIVQALARALLENFEKIIVPNTPILYEFSLMHPNIVYVNNLKDLSRTHNNTPISQEQHRKTTPAVYIRKDITESLIMSVCGKQHLLISGEPGIGKSFSVKHLEHLIPELTIEEKMQRYLSGLGNSPADLIRFPNHNSKISELIGTADHPGEITMAHNGYLATDEIGEWGREKIEALRQPLERDFVTIGQRNVPCKFTLIGTLNPCRCGNSGSLEKICVCNQRTIKSYRDKFSFAFLERIPLKLRLKKVEVKEHVSLVEIQEKIKHLNEKIACGELLDVKTRITETLCGTESFQKMTARSRENILKNASILFLLCKTEKGDSYFTAINKAIRYQFGRLFD